jgi:hypothetical protein
MIICSVQLITGCMVGLEFPEQEGIVCVIDLGIIRVLFERYTPEEEGTQE